MRYNDWVLLVCGMVIGTACSLSLAASWPAFPFHEWVIGLSSSAATFWATLMAATIGFIGLIAANLYNAHLTRQRDKLRDMEYRRALAASLRSEVHGVKSAVQMIMTRLYQEKSEATFEISSYLSRPEQVIYRASADKIGNLGAVTAGQLALMTHFIQDFYLRIHSGSHTAVTARMLGIQTLMMIQNSITCLEMIESGASNEEIDAYASQISNEMKEPLTNIASQLNGVLDERVAESLRRMRGASEVDVSQLLQAVADALNRDGGGHHV